MGRSYDESAQIQNRKVSKIKQSAVLPIDHVPLSLAGQTKLNKKMDVIVCFLDLIAIAYNKDERLNITYISDILAYGRAA
jgi:hypothetical protein